MTQNQTIGQNIKLFREKRGLKQEDLSRYLSVTREEISYYENGRRTIPSALLSKLAALFNVDEYDLYETNPESRTLNLALTFRANQLLPGDLVHIANFQTIVRNYIKMKKLLDNG